MNASFRRGRLWIPMQESALRENALCGMSARPIDGVIIRVDPLEFPRYPPAKSFDMVYDTPALPNI